MKDRAFQDAFDKALPETEKVIRHLPEPFVRCPVCHWKLSVDCCTAGRALIAYRGKAPDKITGGKDRRDE